jgi:methionyl-tRNA synthetase
MKIDFDNFSGTARKPHIKLAQEFFLNLYNNGYINEKVSKQFYCEYDKRFLPDRYVEGICPYCGAKGARGDQCDNCGKLIDAITLVEPKCKLCGHTPIIKETKHWYLKLQAFEEKLKKWIDSKDYWKENVKNFISAWLKDGLIERAITRDIDWGVPVPLPDAEGKVLYVWFDAPIGYISSTIEWSEKIGQKDKWKEYWLDNKAKVIHFLGKDNIPFHAIIWPSILMGQEKNYNLPYDIPANEYLNIQGKKTSTSKNYAIWVEDVLKDFDSELIRYYLAANAPETKDTDFSWEDFQNKINNDLANVLGNLAHRVFSFAKKNYNGILEKPERLNESSQKLIDNVKNLIPQIESDFGGYKVRKAVKNIMDIARLGNKYFDEQTPWKLIKEDKKKTEEVLFVSAELLRKISILFFPVLPQKMKELRSMLSLNTAPLWENLCEIPEKFVISDIKPLFVKITDEEIAVQIEKLNQTTADNVEEVMEHKSSIDIEDFYKMELRVGKVIKAQKVKKSKKLLNLTVEIGNEKRTILSGISQSYSPDEIIGKNVVVLLNLKPRKIMGIESQGMILSAEYDGFLSLLTTDKDIKSGSEIS